MVWPWKPQGPAATETRRRLPTRGLPASAHEKLDPAAFHGLLEHPEPDLLPDVQKAVDLGNGVALLLGETLIVRAERDKQLGKRRFVGAGLVGHPLKFSQSALSLLLSSTPSVLKDLEPGDELRILLLAQVEHLLRTHELERLKQPLDLEGGHIAGQCPQGIALLGKTWRRTPHC